MCLSLCIPVLAVHDPAQNKAVGALPQEEPNVSQSQGMVRTPEEMDREFAEKMAEIMAGIEENSRSSRGPQYHYKYEYFPYVYKTVGGYAGNQISGGYRFETGGGFWFSDSGGPDVSGSVNIGLPKPYDFVSFSINLGQKGSSGYFVTVPNTTDYFKLYVEKKMEMRPYLIYIAPAGTDDWSLDSGGAVQMVFSVNQYAKKV